MGDGQELSTEGSEWGKIGVEVDQEAEATR
jgi:hypothetical protein